MDLKKVQREVMGLSDQSYEFVVEAESRDGRFNTGYTETYELAVEMETWYASAVQIMAATGFRGIGRFERLYEDESFSIPRFVREFEFENVVADSPVDATFIERMWEMHYMLKSLPVAISAASSDEVYGMGAQDIVEYLQGAVGRVAEENLREVGPGARSHIEEAVNLAMARYGIVVERKPDRRRACFQDKVEALQNAGRINGSERERLVRAYSAFNMTAHPATPESGENLKTILADAVGIVRLKLLVSQR